MSTRPEPSPSGHSRDLAATLDGLLAVAMDAVRADAAGIYLWMQGEAAGEDQVLRLEAVKGLPSTALGHRIARGEGLVGRVVVDNRSLVSDDVTVDPRP